jgi:hypothetical protein
MFNEWPELIPPQRVKKDLHFGNKTVYALVKTPGLGIRINNRFYFLKKNFIQWMEQESLKDKSTLN